MRIRVSGIFLFVCITTCLSLAIDRPQTPTIDDVDFDGQTITILGSKDDGDSCHAVLITDLTVPFQYGNDISRSELGSDGAAINWAQENFPMNIKIGNKSVERYYIAVAVSDIIDGKRVFSPWRLYCDSLLGLPVSISTSHDSISETFFRRGRFIDENNGSKLVLDLTFSLATSKASSCKLKLKKNSSVILDIDNLASISGSKTDINDAIQNTSGINNSLIFKRESNGFYLYNIYQMVDYNSSDTFSATLINSDGSLLDSTTNRISAFSDSGYMNIISTISALVRMPDGTNDLFYPSSIPPHSDSVKIDLLLTAMLDLSLAHNSPIPKGNEVSQGIFNNYMQFMDNVAGNWDSLKTVERGINRLQDIHNLILAQNKGEIKDPVSVINRGTSFVPGANTEKKMNYIFTNALTRLNWKVNLPDYSGKSSGVGVMFRVSDNVELYGMRYDEGGIIFDKTPFLNGALERRIIFSACNPLIDTLCKDSGGVWVLGSEESAEGNYYVGVDVIRHPISTVHKGIKVDTLFSLAIEKRDMSDPEGKIMDGEKNIYRIEPIIAGGRTLENVEEGNMFLHGQKRKALYNTDYREPGSYVNFQLFGDSFYVDKVIIESLTDSTAVLHDTSQFNFKKVGIFFVEKLRNVAIRFGRIFLGSYKVLLRDAYNGKLSVVNYLPQKIKDTFVVPPGRAKVYVEDSSYIFPESKRNNKMLTVRWSSPQITITDNSDRFLFPDETNRFMAKEEDRSSMHINIRDWEKIDNYLYSSDYLQLYSERLGTDSIEFSLNNVYSGSEYLKETIRMTSINVSFDSSYTQNFGFDEELYDEEEYVSIDHNGITEIKIKITPFIPNLWIKSSHTELFDIVGGPYELTDSVCYVQLEGKNHYTNYNVGLLQLCLGSPAGQVLKSINVFAAKKKNFFVSLCTVEDSISPMTLLPRDIDTSLFKAHGDSILNQAVAEVDVKEYINLNINYDINKNGILDVYQNGSYNPEIDSITEKMSGIRFIPLIYTKGVSLAYPLTQVANSGQKILYFDTENTRIKELSAYMLVSKNGDFKEEIFVMEVMEDSIKISRPIKYNYETNSALIYKLAGVCTSNDLTVFTDNSNQMYNIAFHEFLHRNDVAGLYDVQDEDNIMYYTNVKSDKCKRLRYRQIMHAYDSYYDMQWELINRD